MQRHTLRLFWQASTRYPLKLALSLIFPVTTVVVGAFLGPYLIAAFFNRLQAGTVGEASIWTLVGAYIVTQIYGEVIGWRVTLWAVWRLEISVMADLYNRSLRHLLGQSLNFHNERFGGSLVSQATKFATSYERFMDTVVFDALPAVTSIVAATVILSFVFWQYAVVLFVLCTVFVASVLLSSRYLAPLTVAETQASTTITGRLADVITNVSAVKSFGRESDELHHYDSLVGKWQDRSKSVMRAYLGVTTGYSVLLLLLKAGALIAAVLAVQQRGIPAGTVFLALTYTFTVCLHLWAVTQIVRSYNRSMSDAHDMTAILQVEPTVVDAASVRTEAQPSRGAITFDRVAFSHDGEHRELFTDFKLAIAPGEHVGLVGSSGSGKTTLTRLLLRFSDLQSGRILIDGADIAQMRQADLRRAISYVPQEPLLFHRSLRDNIAYGRPDATEDEIREAAAKAHAEDFISELPLGLDTLVGERGVKLSGGQRQRIAIARAILKDAPILVLDEATSALDSGSEALIQEALIEAMAGRTAIVIAHRLSTIRRLDRIVVLEGGSIVESGSHDQLLASAGQYAGLWTHQSGGFLTEPQLVG